MFQGAEQRWEEYAIKVTVTGGDFFRESFRFVEKKLSIYIL